MSAGVNEPQGKIENIHWVQPFLDFVCPGLNLAFCIVHSVVGNDTDVDLAADLRCRAHKRRKLASRALMGLDFNTIKLYHDPNM